MERIFGRALLLVAALLVRLRPAAGQGAPASGGSGDWGDAVVDILYLDWCLAWKLSGGHVVLAICICLTPIALCILCVQSRASAYSPPESRRDFVRVDAPAGPAALAVAGQAPAFPSGMWRGYYHQFGQRHALCDFPLDFQEGRGCVEGAGVDDVGHYVVRGVYSQDRVAFSKQYILESLAANGRVNAEMNKGHTVEYRGDRVGASLGLGIRGTWYIADASSGYRGKGAFHLWPAMPDWQKPLPSAPQKEDGQLTPALQTAPPPVVFDVTRDHVCVVCFDRPIDTCLQPCRHAAVCSQCVGLLRPADCPICRARIVGVLGCDGRRADTKSTIAPRAMPPDEVELMSAV